MSVAHRMADPLAEGADHRHEGIAGALSRAGTYSMSLGDEVVTGWHSHDLHQLVYALEGVAEVETDTARYLLPPQQAMWIPAGIEHCTTLTRANVMTVVFDPAMGLPAGDRVRVLAAAPVVREMIRYAHRWPFSRTSSDPLADSFFDVLGRLVIEWFEHETPLCLPTTSDPLVAAAMDFTNEHLADVSLGEVCAAVGTSERSLRRAFVAAAGIPWSRYLQESQLLKAMALLAEQGQSVLSISLTVGFGSVSSFNRAFRRFTGETPIAYRQRTRVSHLPEGAGDEGSKQALREWSHLASRPSVVPARRRTA
jgi:AraC-like DNA-binding protein